MRLKDILLDIRSQIEEGKYRAGLRVILIFLYSKKQRKQYRDLLSSVSYKEDLLSTPKDRLTLSQEYKAYYYNTPLEGFDQEAYKAKRLEILDKVIELCD